MFSQPGPITVLNQSPVSSDNRIVQYCAWCLMMRDRHNKDHRNPRLIKSHWDMDDEFIPSSHDWRPSRSQSSSRAVMLPILTVSVCITAAAIAIKIIRGRFASSTKLADTSPSHLSEKLTISDAAMKCSALTTTTGNLLSIGETGKVEPLLIGEARDKQGVEPKNRREQSPCRESSSCSAIVESEDSLVGDIVTGTTTRLSIQSSSSSPTVEHVVNDAIELAEKIKVTTRIFHEQGLDAKQAHDFVLQRHLSGLQERARRDHENERLAAEFKLRSLELEMKERRHRESIAAQQMDPNWVNKCLAARDSVLKYTITATAWLFCAVALDQLCKSGMDIIGSESVSSAEERTGFSVLSCLLTLTSQLCNCRNHGAENFTTFCIFSSYLCSSTPACWVNCCIKGASSILSVLVFRFLLGCNLLHALPMIASFILWKHLQAILCHILVFGLISSMAYAFVMYRCHSTQMRLKLEQDKAAKLIEDYMIECDQAKMGITLTMVMLLCGFEFAENGFLLSLVFSGRTN